MGVIHAASEKLDFIERAFGRAEIFSKGNVQVLCPKCLEKHKKIGVPLKKRKFAINILMGDIFHCWVCGYHGRLSMALKRYCSSKLLIEYLKKFADQKTLTAMAEPSAPKKREIKLPTDYRLLALNQNSKNLNVKKAIAYAKNRGLSERDFWYFKVGVSDEWPWYGRILFPSFDTGGNFNYMVGRSFLENPKYKYWDTPVDATSIVFNEINIDWSQEITITEGLLDLVKCNDNAVPLLGSDLKVYSALFGMIIKNETPVLLAMDQDMAYRKMPEIVDLFLKSGVKLRVLQMGEYEDVGDMTKEEFAKRRESAPHWNRMSLLVHKISEIKTGPIL